MCQSHLKDYVYEIVFVTIVLSGYPYVNVVEYHAALTRLPHKFRWYYEQRQRQGMSDIPKTSHRKIRIV